MNKNILIAISCLALIACNDPKSTVIPQNMEKLSEDKHFIEQGKKLEQKDKDLLTGYLARAALSQAFGKGEIPSGTTIGDAIDNQKQWLAEQEVQTKKEKEVRNLALQKLESGKKSLREAFQIVYVKRGEINKQNFTEHLPIYFNFKNTSGKAISGFKADIIFTDMFGKEFQRLSIEESQTIPADLDTVAAYQWDYSKYDDNMVKLNNLEEGKFKVEAYPTHIVFADGTTLRLE